MLNRVDRGLTIQPITPENGEKSLILKLSGRLVGEFAHLLKRAAEPVLISPTAPKIILDMTEVKYIDSTGIGVIISIIRNLRDRGGTMEINGLNHAGIKLFDILNLTRLECVVIDGNK